MKNKFKKILSHIIWLFVLGCILGFIIETGWHFLKNGEFINKQGLLYGPFKPIYGSGLVIITGILYHIKDEKAYKIFLSGILIGTIFEYFASIFLEVAYNSYIWTYESYNFNLNGRIYLPYCMLWGVISLLWIKKGLPLYLKIYKNLESKKFNTITTFVGIFMIINILLTSLALYRHSKRIIGLEPKNKIEEKIDNLYPNEIINKKFPKFRIYQ